MTYTSSLGQQSSPTFEKNKVIEVRLCLSEEHEMKKVLHVIIFPSHWIDSDNSEFLLNCCGYPTGISNFKNGFYKDNLKYEVSR